MPSPRRPEREHRGIRPEISPHNLRSIRDAVVAS